MIRNLNSSDQVTELKELIDIYDGDEFEQICCKLIGMKYGEINFQEIPATHKGDLGLDGYSFASEYVAYQCYAPNKLYTTQDLYEHQRDKMSADINKFIKNSKDIQKLINPNKFKRWVFLTPLFESKLLNQHANKKTQEVLKANLPYVDKDFKIIIKTPDEFLSTEIDIYKNQIRSYLHITNPTVDSKDVVDWQRNHTGLVTALTVKLQKIGLTGTDLNDSIDLNVRYYLMLQKTLNEVLQSNKDIYDDLLGILESKTKSIEYSSKMKQVSKISDISGELTDLSASLTERLGDYIKPEIRNELATFKIADWLVRCPLDFK